MFISLVMLLKTVQMAGRVGMLCIMLPVGTNNEVTPLSELNIIV